MNSSGHAAIEDVAIELELCPNRNLAGTGSTKVGSDGAAHYAEARSTEIVVRIAEIDVVEDVGEGAFRLDVQALGDGECLTDAGGKVDESGALHHAIPSIAEAADRQRVRAGSAAGEAGTPERPRVITGATEGGGIDPIQAALGSRVDADAAHAVGILVTVTRIPTGIRGVEARAGPGGIFLATGKGRSKVSAGLHGEDARQPPAADQGIRKPRHV